MRTNFASLAGSFSELTLPSPALERTDPVRAIFEAAPPIPVAYNDAAETSRVQVSYVNSGVIRTSALVAL